MPTSAMLTAHGDTELVSVIGIAIAIAASASVGYFAASIRRNRVQPVGTAKPSEEEAMDAGSIASTEPGTDDIDRVLLKGADVEADDKAQLFELYKVMVQTSESLVARRQGTNTFFLAVNGFLLTVLGLFIRSGADVRRNGLVVAALCLTGLIISWAWRSLLISFGQLNTGKFAVILRLEKHLSAAIFDAEWEALQRGSNKKVYRSFTKSESRVPLVFMGVYVLAAITSLLLAMSWLPF